MQKNDVFEGQWVRFLTTDTKDTFTGFVVSKEETEARVAIPSLNKSPIRKIPYVSLHSFEAPKFDSEAIDALIDVALDNRDLDWVGELAEMKGVMNQWN